MEDPIAYRPIPTTRETWLLAADVDPTRKWLVVLGELSERKSLSEIVSALKTDRMQNVEWGLLAIGRADSETRTLLEESVSSSACSVAYKDCFLTDEEFDTWISIADAVAVLHKNEGSSGVLLKCWAAQTPVLVGGAKSVLRAAEVLALQAIPVTSLSPHRIALALSEVQDRDLAEGRDNSAAFTHRQMAFADALLSKVPQGK